MPAPDWPTLRHLAQRACPQCTARHQGSPVRRLFTHHEYLCTRHGYWIGPPDPTHDAPPPRLAASLPELVAAQRWLHRTARRYGWASVFDAAAVATKICVDLRFSAEAHPLWMRWERRLDLLMPAGYRRSMFMAVIFPEVAALTAVLAAPDWRVLAKQGDPADDDRLVHTPQRALGCVDPPRRHDLNDALIGWMANRATGPRLQPAATYPDTGHHDNGTPQVTDQYRLAEHLTVVHFQRDRRAPRTHNPGRADALRPPARPGWRPHGEVELIPKVHQRSPIRHLGWLLGYLFGPGLDNERGSRHDDPRVIAAWAYATADGLTELQPPPSLHGRPSVRRLTELLEQPVRICFKLPARPVWHCSIHNHPDDPVLTDRQWEHVATEIAAAVGLAPHGDPDAARWIGIRHAAGHVHIVATLARQDRRAEWLWQDYRRAQACCREQEQRYRLHRVGGRATAERYPTPAELNKTTRQQRDQVPRDQLRRTVRTAAAGADGEQGFLDRLRAYGVLVRPRTSTTNPNQLTGYAVALPDDHNAAGDTIWYSGSTLAADLSLPNLRHRWPSP